MTPISSIIEETIRLQHQTNLYQAISLACILVSDVFILLCIVNIHKATRANRAWSDANARWSAALRAASGMEARSDATPQSGAAEGDSPTAESGTP